MGDHAFGALGCIIKIGDMTYRDPIDEELPVRYIIPLQETGRMILPSELRQILGLKGR